MKMNKINMLSVVMGGILALIAAFPALAATSSPFRPYLNNEVDSQMSAYARDPRSLADWTQTPGQGIRLLKKFYEIGVLDDYEYSIFTKSPVLTVGPGFYRLSRFDQNRVADLVDYVYKGTQKKPGIIFIVDRDTDRVIGLYTLSGLRLE